MWEKEGAQVRDAMLAAKTVAGLPTDGLAEAATASDVTVRDHEGVDKHFKKGEVVNETTPGERVGAAVAAVVGTGPLHEQVIRGGVAAGVTAGLGLGATEGVARRIAGAKPAAQAAAKAEARANHLDAKIKAAEAAGPKANKWEFWKSDAAKLDAMREEMDAAKAEAITKGQLAETRTAGATPFMKTADTALSEINDGSKLKGLLNLPRGAGRLMGDTLTGTVMNVGRWTISSTIGLANHTFALGKSAIEGAVAYGYWHNQRCAHACE